MNIKQVRKLNLKETKKIIANIRTVSGEIHWYCGTPNMKNAGYHFIWSKDGKPIYEAIATLKAWRGGRGDLSKILVFPYKPWEERVRLMEKNKFTVEKYH